MDRRNKEGYLDMTAFHALANVAKSEKAKQYKPLVYIASPYAGDIEHNIERTRHYCRFAVSQGYIPLAPHLHYPQFMDDNNKQERELGLFFALVLLGKCDELWVCGSHVSKGMETEIAKAQKRGMKIKYISEEAVRV